MKQLRLILSACILALLGLGYCSSQYFWFQGRAPEWAQKVDTPAIAWLALALLATAGVFAFLKDPEDKDVAK